MCDIGYVIKDHLGAIMQLLTHDLREYNMQLITTKCLNTAVMMMYLLLGTEALSSTHYCDVENVRKRNSANAEQHTESIAIADQLRRAMTSLSKKRTLFYVMITDGHMPHESHERVKTKSVYFPGHVFVIERTVTGRCNLYQSYINEYDLKTNIDRNGSLSISHEVALEYVEGIQSLMNKRTWDAGCTAFWKKLTGVDASQFERHVIRGNLLLCFKQVNTKTCITKLRTLVDSRIAKLSGLPPSERNDVYGDPSMYNDRPDDIQPLTNMAMLQNLVTLRKKL